MRVSFINLGLWGEKCVCPLLTMLDAVLAKAEAAARDELRGAWRTQAELMARKSAERPK